MEKRTGDDRTSDPMRRPGLDDLLADYTSGYFEFNPAAAVNGGLHEFDGRLPDFSPDGIRAKLAWLEDMRARTMAIRRDGLDVRDRLLRDYLEIVIDTELFNIRVLKVLENNTWYDYLALDPNVYVARDYAPPEVRMDAYTRHARALPTAIAAMRDTVKPMPSGHARGFQDYLDGLATFVTTVPYDAFASVRDEGRQAAMRQANDEAAAALTGLSRWIGGSPRDEAFALGRDRFAQFLWDLERIDTAAGELEEMAQKDLERNMQTLRRACESFSPGASIEDCRARVASRKPIDGPVAAATRQVAMLRQRIVERDIVSLPDEEVIVAESPPHMRTGTAYISVAGPYESPTPSFYYVSPPDPTWSAEDQAAFVQSEADLMTTTTHCVWPGHILEAVRCHRHGNPLAAFTYSYAYCEGWCVYSEEMMLHEALDDDPELAIGQLQNALMGDVRVLVAVGLHTGGMTIPEAERLFREKAFCDPGSAREEAVRGSFDPGYLFYTAGKWMVEKLRDDWLALHPRGSLRDFHEAFLSLGDVPIVLLRKALLGDADDGVLFPSFS